MPSCVAIGCSTRAGNGKAKLYSFPKDKDLRRKWILKLRRPKWKPGSFDKLCALHFVDEDFRPKKEGKTRIFLKPNAVPSQRLPIASCAIPVPPRTTNNSQASSLFPVIIEQKSPETFPSWKQDHCYEKKSEGNPNVVIFNDQNAG